LSVGGSTFVSVNEDIELQVEWFEILEEFLLVSSEGRVGMRGT